MSVLGLFTDNALKDGTGDAINGAEVDANPTVVANVLDGTTIEALGSVAAVQFTAIDINGGTIDGTTVGATSASTGAFTTLTASGVLTGLTVEATGDTSAGDNAAMGYNSADGMVLTGQGSTNDVNIKNDAGNSAIRIPTGTQNVVFGSAISAGAATVSSVLAASNDVGAIGASGTAFSDLFLASGGVVNFDSGNATMTHATDKITLAMAGATATSEFILDATGTSGTGRAELTIDAKTAVASRIAFAQNGTDQWLIGAGAVSDGTTFEVFGNGANRLTITTAGVVNIANLTASSDVQTDGSKNLVSVSDERLKVDLGTIADGALDVVNQLVPKYFKWQSDVDNNIDAKQLGFFAQQVNPLIPEAAPAVDVLDDDGNVVDTEWGFNGRAITAYLVKAMQELTTRVESLEA